MGHVHGMAVAKKLFLCHFVTSGNSICEKEHVECLVVEGLTSHLVMSLRPSPISNTIKENPEVLEEYSSLVFGVNHKCYGFLESLELQDY